MPNAGYAGRRLRQTKRNTGLTRVVGKRFDDLPVYELQDGWPLVDQRDLST